MQIHSLSALTHERRGVRDAEFPGGFSGGDAGWRRRHWGIKVIVEWLWGMALSKVGIDVVFAFAVYM
jgi:hypothetical protein